MRFWKKFLILGSLVLGILVICWGVKVGKESQGLGRKAAEPAKVIEGKPFKFAVMADIHSDWENFQEALKKAKEDEVEFVVIAGDLTTIGKKSELLESKKFLDESGLKYYVIPGNHDIWWGRKYKQDVWKEVFGESFMSFKATKQQSSKEIKFILVNNSDGIGGLEGLEGTEGQKEWLWEEIKECLKVYCLAFLHVPLNHPSSLHVMGEDNPRVASEAGELVRLFVQDKVKEVFTGHLHFSSSYEIDGLKTTVVGVITAERNFQSPKFLEIWEEGGKLAEKEVFVAN